MKRFLFLLLFISTSACSQENMITPPNAIEDLRKFKLKEKFNEDSFPGLSEPGMKEILSDKINLTVDDFIEIAKSPDPTAKKYQEKIKVGLGRFSNIYLDLDTEDRERICMYFEELMDVIGLESSNGLLNDFMYKL